MRQHRIFLSWSTMALALVTASAVMAGTLHPTPQAVEETDTPLALEPSVQFSENMNDEQMSFLRNYVGNALEAGGFSQDEGQAGITIRFHRYTKDDFASEGLPDEAAPFVAMEEEGYVLVARAKQGGGVELIVAAKTPHGLFNGGMTTLGLLLDDAGQAETTLTPQVIRDYPDQPKRGGYLYSMSLQDDKDAYAFTPEHAQRLNELARMKVNLLFIPKPSTEGAATWETAKAGMMALRDACRDRFIEPVFSAGSLRESYDYAYRDGWWIRREPFHVESVIQKEEILNNPSFEDIHACSPVPKDWVIKMIPSGGTWTLDTNVAHEGQTSMRLHIPTPSNLTNDLRMSQTTASPGPGSYGLSVWVRTENIQGKELQVTFYGLGEVDGKLVTVTDVLSVLVTGTNDWTHFVKGPITVGAEVLKWGVYARVQSGGSGTAWIDDVHILPMEKNTANQWAVVQPEEVAVDVAAPDVPSKQLLVNGNLNLDEDNDGTPDGWGFNEKSNSQATWTLDETVAHCGSRSMRLDAPDAAASGGDTSNDVTLRQSVEDIAPGNYLISAWFKTENIADQKPQLTAYTTVMDDGGLSITGVLQSSEIKEGAKEGTKDWTFYGVVLKVPEASQKLTVYARIQEPGHGTLWIDDVWIQRIDGGLRNVLRKNYDVRVESEDLKTLYQPGVDYTIEDGKLQSRYAPDLKPTVIRRLPNGAIPPNAALRISYDANLFYKAERYTNQGYNICTPHALNEVFKPALDRLITDLGSTAVNLNSDEIRGFNRSGVCHNQQDGSLKQSNAVLLADYFNEILAYGKGLNPDLKFYAWDDMFSSYHNGGIEDYQTNYGGSPGKTDVTVTDGLLDSDLRMMVWWYKPLWIHQMTRSMDFFSTYGHKLLVSPHYNATNIADWAAISAAYPISEGVVITPWDGHEEGMEPAAELFWNLEWEQVLFADFEGPDAAALATQDYAFTDGATWSGDGSCSSPHEYPKGSNPGGVCISTGGGTVSLPAVAIDNTSQYRFTAHARHSEPVAGTLEAEWRFSSGDTVTEQYAIELGGEGGFARRQVAFAPPDGPPWTAELGLQLVVGPHSEMLSLDNLMLWRSRGACPDGRAVAKTAELIDLGSVTPNETFQLEAQVCSSGCEDLVIQGILVTPEIGLTFPDAEFPAILPASTCRSFAGEGTLPDDGQSLHAILEFETNAEGSTTVEILGTLREEGRTDENVFDAGHSGGDDPVEDTGGDERGTSDLGRPVTDHGVAEVHENPAPSAGCGGCTVRTTHHRAWPALVVFMLGFLWLRCRARTTTGCAGRGTSIHRSPSR